MSLEVGHDFEALLEFLQQNRGFDFRGYKRPTLARRVGKRVQHLGLSSFADYLDYVQVHPDEFPLLFNTILINVTDFFRDKVPWDYLAAEVIPQIVDREPERRIRVWSAGCASGEEAYSIAMLLCEALGPEAFVERVKIYATDVDEEALAAARAGYPSSAMTSVPDEFVSRYFEVQGDRHLFRSGLRRALVFGRHDLIQDAPISRIDLLLCRNTLIYFTAESQAKVLARFHYALADNGFLFLGRAEMLLTHGRLFQPLELKQRVFEKVRTIADSDRLVVLAEGGNVEASDSLAGLVRIRELAAEQVPVPQIVIDSAGIVVAANGLARRQFGMPATDVGRPFYDLVVSYQPAELRPSISRANADREPISLEGIRHELHDRSGRFYDIHLVPLLDEAGDLVGTSISFLDTTQALRLQAELVRAKQEVETAYEELQSSNEELETTNEELQSTVEELETTNEELQSTNEELETMNEELESTNSELQAINTDIHVRTDEINRLNAFQDSILSSVDVGVAVLDAQLRVLQWSPRSEDLWGTRSEEAVGNGFFDLDIGLPDDELRRLIGLVMESGQRHVHQTVAATNRRGRSIRCRISVAPIPSMVGSAQGVVLTMEELTAGEPDEPK